METVMRSVLLSIKPKWCELIIRGEKTIEIRKTRPKIELPFKCYIYCTQGSIKDLSIIGQGIYEKRMQVIGEFVCDEILPIRIFENGSIQNYMCYNLDRSCVDYDAIAEYIGKGNIGYGWHIFDLVIYDQPKNLGELTGLRNTKFGYEPTKVERPPQSYMFVESLEEI